MGVAVAEFALYDNDDSTWHAGGGEWVKRLHQAEIYPSRELAQKALEDVDEEKVLRERLEIVPVEPCDFAADLSDLE